MKNQINLSILTYNEEERIEAALRCACQWASNIFIFDKGSTDRTASIAKAYGAEVIQIPFSAQGAEDCVEIHNLIKQKLTNNQWYLWLTPGEVPTRNLINMVNTVVSTNEYEKTDVFCLPVRIMTFGKYREWGPWRVSYQPRLVNTTIANVQNKVHDHIIKTEKTLAIPESDDVNILHPTHVSFSKFIKTHHDYAISEEFGVDLRDRVNVSVKMASQFDHEFFNQKLDDDLRPLFAWKIYCYMVALRTLDVELSEMTKENIKKVKEEYMAREWKVF